MFFYLSEILVTEITDYLQELRCSAITVRQIRTLVSDTNPARDHQHIMHALTAINVVCLMAAQFAPGAALAEKVSIFSSQMLYIHKWRRQYMVAATSTLSGAQSTELLPVVRGFGRTSLRSILPCSKCTPELSDLLGYRNSANQYRFPLCINTNTYRGIEECSTRSRFQLFCLCTLPATFQVEGRWPKTPPLCVRRLDRSSTCVPGWKMQMS